MISRRNVPPRVLAFVDAYTRLGKGAPAAREAGYAEKGAHTAAHRLLRNATVQELIGAKSVNRGVHAEETYRNTIAYTNAALREMARVLQVEPREGATAEDMDRLVSMKARMIDAAGRALERLGRIEGLYVERIAVKTDQKLSLQVLIEEFSKSARENRIPVIDIQKIETPAAPPADGNGHGGGNGNGHASDGVAPTG